MSDGSAGDDQAPDDAASWSLALPYARAGLRVFPVDMRPGDDGRPRKAPLPGYLWKERATSKINHVVEDFDEAARIVDVYQLGVGWALGLDGYVALDLDSQIAPRWWPTEAPINRTPRGEHRIFLQPDGMVVGNGIGRFPAPRNWGEVRGHGGYIVIAAWDRPGFEVEQLANVTAFPHPDWLTPATADVLALPVDELRAWSEAHVGPSGSPLLKGYATRLDQWDASRSRHEVMVEVVCWAAREVSAGLVDAAEAMAVTDEWWRRHADERGRKVGRRELLSIWQWGVSVAMSDPARLELLRQQHAEGAVRVERIAGERGSWGTALPIDADAEPIAPTMAVMSNGAALLHVDRLNLLYGDSGSGKSWLLAFAVSECVALGIPVLVADIEDTPAVLAGRLRQLGVQQVEMDRCLTMVHPDEPANPQEVDELLELIAERAVRHVFIDSLGEAFGLDGVNENADDEVIGWVARVARRIIAAGAGCTLVDHITKAADNPLHPSGSKRKRAAVTGTAWWLYGSEPFTKETGGRAVLRCAKDRHGNYRRGDDVAELVMSPFDLITGLSTLELRPVPVRAKGEGDGGAPLRLSVVFTNVVKEYGPLSANALAEKARELRHKFSNNRASGAIELAVDMGWIGREEAGGNGHRYTWLADPPIEGFPDGCGEPE